MSKSQKRHGNIWKHFQASILRLFHRLHIELIQWWILTQRHYKVKMQDRWYFRLLIFQPFAIGILLILVFYSVDPYSIEIMSTISISALWFGTFSSIREIVSEQAIYQRERRVNLKITSYVFSKLPFLLIICLIQCLILQILISIGVTTDTSLGFNGNLLRATSMFIIMLMTASAGVALGLMLSTLAIILGKQAADRSGMTSSEVAMTLVPIALLPQVILGGPFIRVTKSLFIARIASKLTVSRWTLTALLNLRETHHLSYIERTKYNRILLELGMEDKSIFWSCVIMCFLWIFFIIATMIILKLQEISQKSSP